MGSKVYNLTSFHTLLAKLVSEEYPQGVYTSSFIGPIETELYDDYGLQLLDINYGGDVFDRNGALVANREEIGNTFFDSPRYNVNVQFLLRDIVQWMLMQLCPDKHLYFNCKLTDSPVPLISPDIMEFRYLNDILKYYIGEEPSEGLLDSVEIILKPIIANLDINSIYDLYYLDNYNVIFVNTGSVKELRYEYLLLER